MKKKFLPFLLSFIGLFFTAFCAQGQASLDSLLPVRGFSISAPRPDGVDSFVQFINDELAPRKVNTLILQIDYRYQFKSHPELADTDALSESDVKKIVKACKENHIHLIPQMEMLGHQSWANHLNKLLTVYPQFDETPWVKMPADYKWPNADNLYCKSYCPLYPGIHKILFDVIDEICDVFETDAFHAGMDEVFYIGEDKCPRCGGRDKSELFAGEVRTLHDHLAQKGRQLWIWGDRLLDGKTTGLGEWEASYNNTYRAIDMIPKDVVICDWHYERADKSAVYFAMKGFHVLTCPWRKPDVAVQQVKDMVNFRQTATPEMSQRFQGVVETVWTDDPQNFINAFYEKPGRVPARKNNALDCFRTMYDAIEKLQ